VTGHGARTTCAACGNTHPRRLPKGALESILFGVSARRPLDDLFYPCPACGHTIRYDRRYFGGFTSRQVELFLLLWVAAFAAVAWALAIHTHVAE
jgi:hypothetical protein